MRPDVFAVEGSDPPVVCLIGECDLVARDQLRAVLHQLRGPGTEPRVTIDMKHVTFIDSSIVGVIAAAVRDMTVVLRNVPEPIDRVLRTAGLDQFVERLSSQQ